MSELLFQLVEKSTAKSKRSPDLESYLDINWYSRHITKLEQIEQNSDKLVN